MVSKTRLGSSWSFLVGKTGMNQITTQMETYKMWLSALKMDYPSNKST